MNFYSNQLFHVYNQGNNGQIIFYNDEDYRYFLWKMRAYLLPFGDLIAYCLMPTHFHWQFWVRETAIKRSVLRSHADKIEQIRRLKKYGPAAKPVDRTAVRKAKDDSFVTLNESIGIIEKSYTRTINEEKGWTGSLFRKACNAKDGWVDECITLNIANNKPDYRFLPGTDYAYNCFCYIHDNPVEAGLVNSNFEWIYSSAKDYAGMRNGTLCNLKLGKELLGLI
jgi:putative transposase